MRVESPIPGSENSAADRFFSQRISEKLRIRLVKGFLSELPGLLFRQFEQKAGKNGKKEPDYPRLDLIRAFFRSSSTLNLQRSTSPRMTNKQRTDLIERHLREHKYADLHSLADQFGGSLS